VLLRRTDRRTFDTVEIVSGEGGIWALCFDDVAINMRTNFVSNVHHMQEYCRVGLPAALTAGGLP
jgi:hypothetical protein